METLNDYFYDLFFQFYAFPIVIQIALFITMILCSLYLFFCTRLVLCNIRQSKQKKYQEYIYNRYKLSIERILLSEEKLNYGEITDIIGEIGSQYKKNCFKEQITELIIYSKEHLNKKMNLNNYNELLSFFNLYEYWNAQVINGSKNRKINGIRKLNGLGGNHYSGIMSRYLYHRNTNLRKLARIEYIKFGEDNACKFLEEGFDKRFTRLDEVRLHEAFKEKYKQNTLPLLTRFIKEKEDEKYKQFLIREIGFFYQYECAGFLLSLLSKEKNSQIKKEIIKTLGVLKFKPALNKIYAEYNMSAVISQVVIIEAIYSIGGEKSSELLRTIYNRDSNSYIRRKIESLMKKKTLFEKKVDPIEEILSFT